MDKLNPRAIIFDLGSTLIEYEKIPWDEMGDLCVESGRQALLKNGCEVPSREKFNAGYNEVRDSYRERATDSLQEWTVPEIVAEFFERADKSGRGGPCSNNKPKSFSIKK